MTNKNCYLTIKNNTNLTFDLDFIRMKWGDVKIGGVDILNPGESTLIHLTNSNHGPEIVEGYIKYKFKGDLGNIGATIHVDYSYQSAYFIETVFFKNSLSYMALPLDDDKAIKVVKTQSIKKSGASRDYHVELHFLEN